MRRRHLLAAACLLAATIGTGCIVPGPGSGSFPVLTAREAWGHVRSEEADLVASDDLVAVFAAEDRRYRGYESIRVPLEQPGARPHEGEFTRWVFVFDDPDGLHATLVSINGLAEPGDEDYVQRHRIARSEMAASFGPPPSTLDLLDARPIDPESDWFDSDGAADRAADRADGWSDQADTFGAIFLLQKAHDRDRPHWGIAAPAFRYPDLGDDERLPEPPERVVLAMDGVDGSALDPAALYPPLEATQENATVVVSPEEGNATFEVPTSPFGVIALANRTQGTPSSNGTVELSTPGEDPFELAGSWPGPFVGFDWWTDPGDHTIRITARTEGAEELPAGEHVFETALCWGPYPRDPLDLGLEPWSCGTNASVAQIPP